MTTSPPAVFSALADDTRWSILSALSSAELSASALSHRLPVTRQAIAKHLGVLAAVGLVEAVPHGREVRYRALGARLGEVASQLSQLGEQWDRRLAAIKSIAEEA